MTFFLTEEATKKCNDTDVSPKLRVTNGEDNFTIATYHKNAMILQLI
jgi:hypothetical protein